MTRKVRIIPKLSLLAALAFPLAAHADLFDFTVEGSAGGFSGTGILDTTPQGGGQFLITGISGPGVLNLIAPGLFQGNDNLLFPTSVQQLDSHGFSFVDFTGPPGNDLVDVNIAFVGGSYRAIVIDLAGNPETVPATFEAEPIPEPSSLLLLATGALGLAAIARRRLSLTASH